MPGQSQFGEELLGVIAERDVEAVIVGEALDVKHPSSGGRQCGDARKPAQHLSSVAGQHLLELGIVARGAVAHVNQQSGAAAIDVAQDHDGLVETSADGFRRLETLGGAPGYDQSANAVMVVIVVLVTLQ